MARVYERRPQIDRFWDMVESEPNSGCWLWVGALQEKGYGVFQKPDSYTTGNAHKFSYLYHRGEMPTGLELDHLCRVHSCVNPWHLEAVPRRVNLLRGLTFNAANVAKTHCPQGHPYEGRNLRVVGNRYGIERRCRQCENKRSREAQRARRLAVAA